MIEIKSRNRAYKYPISIIDIPSVITKKIDSNRK